jgi:hypothetical protein
MHLDGIVSYDEAMSASDSPTNLAWLINQNAPTARVDAMPGEKSPTSAKRPGAGDFSTLRIEPAMLDRGR